MVYFGQFVLKITKVAQIYGLLFPKYRFCIKFDKNWFWTTLLAIFSQTRPVTLRPRRPGFQSGPAPLKFFYTSRLFYNLLTTRAFFPLEIKFKFYCLVLCFQRDCPFVMNSVFSHQIKFQPIKKWRLVKPPFEPFSCQVIFLCGHCRL
jgi:hypothetical protein